MGDSEYLIQSKVIIAKSYRVNLSVGYIARSHLYLVHSEVNITPAVGSWVYGRLSKHLALRI